MLKKNLVICWSHKEEPKLTGKQKATLIVFALAFVVMIIGFIPWVNLMLHYLKVGVNT